MTLWRRILKVFGLATRFDCDQGWTAARALEFQLDLAKRDLEGYGFMCADMRLRFEQYDMERAHLQDCANEAEEHAQNVEEQLRRALGALNSKGQHEITERSHLNGALGQGS